jgi:hypothetical protein
MHNYEAPNYVGVGVGVACRWRSPPLDVGIACPLDIARRRRISNYFSHWSLITVKAVLMVEIGDRVHL